MIDITFFSNFRKECVLTSKEFSELEPIASEVLLGVCLQPVSIEMMNCEDYKKALSYQIEFIKEQGGVNVIFGSSELALSAKSESIGGYSVSGVDTSTSPIKTYRGIPVSPMAIMVLRRLGLLNRHAYKSR